MSYEVDDTEREELRTEYREKRDRNNKRFRSNTDKETIKLNIK